VTGEDGWSRGFFCGSYELHNFSKPWAAQLLVDYDRLIEKRGKRCVNCRYWFCA
jgi:hypothetical protein